RLPTCRRQDSRLASCPTVSPKAASVECRLWLRASSVLSLAITSRATNMFIGEGSARIVRAPPFSATRKRSIHLSLVVQKFGGSSVATAERIMAAARRAIRAKQQGGQVIVVVSARGDTTDELIDLAREISEQPPAREMDMLLSTGEQVSIALMAMAIQSL